MSCFEMSQSRGCALKPTLQLTDVMFKINKSWKCVATIECLRIFKILIFDVCCTLANLKHATLHAPPSNNDVLLHIISSLLQIILLYQ